MEIGVHGRTLLAVVKLVAEELVSDLELVTVRHHPMVGNHVMVIALSGMYATELSAQVHKFFFLMP